MTKLSEVLDPELLQFRIAQGYVRRQVHPTLPYVIYNYTDACQWDRAWDEVTRQTRGLIVHAETGEVLARPFAKFHNYGEPDAPRDLSPEEPVVVTDKLDGSLGVLYDDGYGGAIATRGSFASEQALHATRVWKERYAPQVHVPEGVTLLFEIIYPDNRIVCDYGGLDDLVLLAGVDVAVGALLPVSDVRIGWPGPSVDQFDHDTLEQALAAEPRDGAEGLVVWFPQRAPDAVQVKIKQADYVYLHRIITGLTARRVWESLAVWACRPFARPGKKELGEVDWMVRKLQMGPDRIREILAVGPDWLAELHRSLPDEFHGWLDETVDRLTYEAAVVRTDLLVEVRRTNAEAGGDRKEFARRVKGRALPQVAFAALDGQEVETWAWMQVQPEHEPPRWARSEDVA